jgi:hypothetical protein
VPRFTLNKKNSGMKIKSTYSLGLLAISALLLVIIMSVQMSVFMLWILR